MMCTKTMHNFSICVQSYIKILINQARMKFFLYLVTLEETERSYDFFCFFHRLGKITKVE